MSRPTYTPIEWRAAYHQAVREMKYPARGKTGSNANYIRQRLGRKLAARTLEILAAKRAGE